MTLKVKICRACGEELPAHEFRIVRGWRRRRRDTCELCELEARMAVIRNERAKYARVRQTVENAARECRRRFDPSDD